MYKAPRVWYNRYMIKENIKNVVFDIDGTIADCNHRRHFVSNGNNDWDSFKAETINDTPIEHVCELAKMHVKEGDTVMFVSARNNTERDVTIDQIRNWIGIDDPILFMRGPGDFRPDEIFKRDILEFLRQDDILGQNPDIVYDDRNKVVDMWKSNGVNCIQVVSRQEGNF